MKALLTLSSDFFNKTAVSKLIGVAVKKTADSIRDEIPASMKNSQPMGRLYRRGRNRTHRASAPGQVPAIDSRKLSTSFKSKRVGRTTAEVTTPAPYAARLEYGKGALLPRPSAIPAMQREEKAFLERTRDAIEELVK